MSTLLTSYVNQQGSTISWNMHWTTTTIRMQRHNAVDLVGYKREDRGPPIMSSKTGTDQCTPCELKICLWTSAGWTTWIMCTCVKSVFLLLIWVDAEIAFISIYAMIFPSCGDYIVLTVVKVPQVQARLLLQVDPVNGGTGGRTPGQVTASGPC